MVRRSFSSNHERQPSSGCKPRRNAVRIIKACQSLGIETVAAVSEADRESLAAKLASRSVCIGPPRSIDRYLKTATLVAAAQATACDALHPGYGFLAERAELAQACADNNVTFVGPSVENITSMGDKLQARQIAISSGVPTVPGSDHAKTPREAAKLAEKVEGIRYCSKHPQAAEGEASNWSRPMQPRWKPFFKRPPRRPARRLATTPFIWSATSAMRGILKFRY